MPQAYSVERLAFGIRQRKLLTKCYTLNALFLPMSYLIIPLIFVIGFVVGFLLQKILAGKNQAVALADTLEQKLNAILPKLTQVAGEQTALLAKEKLEATSKNMKDDLDAKRDMIDQTIKTLHLELQKSQEKLEKAERDRIGSFEHLKTQITHQAQQTADLMRTTNNLQRVLSNNQQRGAFGEQVARDLLTMAGFAVGVDYQIQESQEQGTRPDFTVFLPKGIKINIDAKFPYQNLLKMIDSTEDQQRLQYRKLFEQDIKNKVKQVTSRDYINPETVDFVILFIPNEKIFSYIYDEMNAVWMEGLRQKVVFAGPFSFTAILRMVRQSYESFSIQKNLSTVISHIQIFKDEFGKYNDEFVKLEKDINGLVTKFNSVAITRTNKLVKAFDRIQIEGELPDSHSQPLL